MRHIIILAIVALSGCADDAEHSSSASSPPRMFRGARPAELANTEFGMIPNQTITATTPLGTIEIRADDWLKRSYTWEGATRSVVMGARDERWYGSLGIYYPGAGRHWRAHRGITRGVVQEGQQHFETVEAAMAWVAKQQWMPYVYRNDGLMVGWSKTPEREQLNVDVWQVMINGRRPNGLPGAKDTAIQVSPRRK